MQYITDTHIHLQDFNQDFTPNLLTTPHIKKFILVSASQKDFSTISHLYKTNSQKIIPSFGYHPWYANTHYNLDILKEYLIFHPNSLIGEIGLDGIKAEPSQEQHQLFSSQLNLAKTLNRPIIIHGAKAYNHLFQYKEELSQTKFVYHSFTPNNTLLNFLLKTNAYIGLGKTFINHPKATDYFPLLPQNKILFETDAPYQLNENTYLTDTFKNQQRLSIISKIPLKELENILYINTMEFIKCKINTPAQ